MRYVAVRLRSAESSFQAIPAEAAASIDVERAAIHHLEWLADGTVVQLRSVAGDLDAYRSLLDETPACRSSLVSGEDSGLAYAHFEPTEAARAMLEWRTRSPVALDGDVEFDGDELLLTLVGDESAFRPALADLPDAVTYSVVETGERPPSTGGLFRALTDRQREVLSTAVACGYYTNPREATLTDVAAELDVTPGTVGDHLRRIEATVFSLFDDGA